MSERDCLEDEDVARLGEAGYFLKEGWPSRALCLRARALALAARDGGKLRPAGLRRDAPSETGSPVRGDLTFWPPEDEAWSDVRAPFEELRRHLNARAFLGLTRFELQVAQYPANGAGYERHRDAFPGAANRRVTAIVYLNPDWRPEHAGELRIHSGVEARDVAPRMGTAVVFLSERVDHEVRPSFAPRWALTAWYYAT